MEFYSINNDFTVADLPEAATYCLTSKSASANHPCHHCIVSKPDLSNIYLNEHQSGNK